MIRRLVCRLHGGHRIYLLPSDPENVSRIAYTCWCQRRFMTRATRDRMLHERLAQLEGTVA